MKTELIIIATCVVTLFVIAQNRFNRRGAGGLQHFSSFFLAVIVSVLEWVLWHAAWIVLLITAGKLFIHLIA